MKKVYLLVVKTFVSTDSGFDTVSELRFAFSNFVDADTFRAEKELQLRSYGFEPHGSVQMVLGNVVVEQSIYDLPLK